jgi:ABC-type nitrate/sulfonate/bicarbonate transport system ATPase subunit
MIHITNISKSYIHPETRKKMPVLDSVNLNISEGELLAILGPTGCGKTTFLRILSNLTQADTGIIRHNSLTRDQLASQITMVTQDYSLFPWMKVIDNATLPMKAQGVARRKRQEEGGKILSRLGLAGFERAFPRQLSGGMQQRCAIARALLSRRNIFLLDEPFAALDEKIRHRLQKEYLEIHKKEKKTTLLVTHSVDESVFMADRIIFMSDRPGKISGSIPIPLVHPRQRISHEYSEVFSRVRETYEQLIGN